MMIGRSARRANRPGARRADRGGPLLSGSRTEPSAAGSISGLERSRPALTRRARGRPSNVETRPARTVVRPPAHAASQARRFRPDHLHQYKGGDGCRIVSLTAGEKLGSFRTRRSGAVPEERSPSMLSGAFPVHRTRPARARHASQVWLTSPSRCGQRSVGRPSTNTKTRQTTNAVKRGQASLGTRCGPTSALSSAIRARRPRRSDVPAAKATCARSQAYQRDAFLTGVRPQVLEGIGVDRSDPLPNPRPIEEAPH
jgi:hypothetical protein